MHVIQIGQRGPVLRLQTAGLIPRKSLRCDFPTGIPQDLLAAFVRGYFDGNGCVGLYRNPSLSPASMPRLKSKFVGAADVLAGIQRVLSKTDIDAKKLTAAGRVWQANYNHRDSVLLAKFIYADGGPHLTRKRLIFDEGMAQPFREVRRHDG